MHSAGVLFSDNAKYKRSELHLVKPEIKNTNRKHKNKKERKSKKMNTNFENQIMELLDQAALEKVKECHSLPVDQIKQFIFGLIPAGQFRLRKWNNIKSMTDEEIIVIVFENYRDRVSQNQLDVMLNQ